MPTVQELLLEAQRARQASDIDRSEALCRQIVIQDPECGAAWHLLASICHSRGKSGEALDCHLKAAEFLSNIAPVQYDLGFTYHALGRLKDAEAAYRRALEIEPTHVSAQANLAAALHHRGELQEAADCYRRAIEHAPQLAEFHTYLGMVLKDQQKFDEAVEEHHRALMLKPNLAIAHNNLGLTLQNQGRVEEAIASYQQALVIEEQSQTYFNLGMAYRRAGRIDDAIQSYRQSIAINPKQANAYINLGVIWEGQGKLDEALAAYEQALVIHPDSAHVLNNMGSVYEKCGQQLKAVECFRRALSIQPQFTDALYNLALSFIEQGNLDEAANALKQVISLRPDSVEAHGQLGNARKDQARLDEALRCYRQALAQDSGAIVAHSNLCFALQYCPGITPAEILAEHQRWHEQHAAPFAKHIRPYSNDRNPDRRLRIGYVSPDFRNHCQAFFMAPLLSRHNHQDFEIFCYADVASPDPITAHLKTFADHWRDIYKLTGAQTVELIRTDKIDILVDLTMHMKHNHLLVFAHKPAPVQICWLAYPGTTGLATIDYRLTDPYIDPPGLFDQYYSEETIRLPNTFWCYDPLSRQPAVNGLPALAAGHITFGCLNNFCKLNNGTFELFIRVLNAVERSRLMLYVSEGSHRERTRDFFVERGITADRLTFVPRRPRRAYLEQYNAIDIGLDTLPYNGHTTSLDAFWMGVPVVTLVGETVVGRAGLSQLTNLGLTELIAQTPEEYIAIVARLASDLSYLAELRATLREKMQKSPLMNAPLFAKHMEDIYRKVWQRWCINRRD